MLLMITCTRAPAEDLGWLLHKNPDRPQTIDLSFGKAHVVFPEAEDSRCTAALLLEMDPIELVRGKVGQEGGPLEHYVNDRPYCVSSFMSTALARAFGTALSGRCMRRPDLVDELLPLEFRLEPIAVRGGHSLLESLFSPLDYQVEAVAHPVDETDPSWGTSQFMTVTLRGEHRLQDALSHLFVLIPVLDDNKHHYVGEDEISKLMRHGEGWLDQHPARALIVRRYLGNHRSLIRAAMEVLVQAAQDLPEDTEGDVREAAIEAALTAAVEAAPRVRLQDIRIEAAARALAVSGARRVLDLGCGEGDLLIQLVKNPQFEQIVGMDASSYCLDAASRRLRLDRDEGVAKRVRLIPGALGWRDERLVGFDAAALVEVIEHIDPIRLGAVEKAVFAAARPGTVIVSTPNREYNALYPGLAEGRLRHPDHRFEWTRQEFRGWADGVAARYGYALRFEPVGAEHPDCGPPTQMAIFTLNQEAA